MKYPYFGPMIGRHDGMDWSTARVTSSPALDLMQELIDGLRESYQARIDPGCTNVYSIQSGASWVSEHWTDSGMYIWGHDHGFREWSQSFHKGKENKNPCPMTTCV